ncbi:hypothetical protein M514_01487 [Trichuris suis]|uniref:Uncharacterized protein n=1 Tax=Trichuris suis TaxID=68888 RepID=A0A085NI96_9BILA|nr:hypothetical protein M514_01487 [Trichuris suis]
MRFQSLYTKSKKQVHSSAVTSTSGSESGMATGTNRRKFSDLSLDGISKHANVKTPCGYKFY